MMAGATEHDFYSRDSALTLAPIAWPDGKPLALAFVVSAEYYDLFVPATAYTPANVPGGFGRGPYPDYRAFSMREYGNRVGVFRLMDLLTRFGLKASLAVDASVARSRTEILQRAMQLGWDLVGHGLSVTDVISESMSESQERDYLSASLEPLRRASARNVTGWHGAEYAQSTRTLPLLVEQGISYMLDWPHDERVVPMVTPTGTIFSLPMSVDLDDVMAHHHRKISMQQWKRSVTEAVEVLASEGGQGGRLLILNLHAWLMGQPYRTSHLAELLASLSQRKDVWFTTTDAIAAQAAAALSRTSG